METENKFCSIIHIQHCPENATLKRTERRGGKKESGNLGFVWRLKSCQSESELAMIMGEKDLFGRIQGVRNRSRTNSRHLTAEICFFFFFSLLLFDPMKAGAESWFNFLYADCVDKNQTARNVQSDFFESTLSAFLSASLINKICIWIEKAEPHSSVGSVVDLKTRSRWFDPHEPWLENHHFSQRDWYYWYTTTLYLRILFIFWFVEIYYF